MGDKITGEFRVGVRGQSARRRWEHDHRGEWDRMGGERGGAGGGLGGQGVRRRRCAAVAAVGRRIPVNRPFGTQAPV